ncbi:hypothetical protein CPB86DRAFT_819462 [Serendipita vermifera]|nr:hypothetical protein CPB86DRAFT_819462 [Serendipita vermifera]
MRSKLFQSVQSRFLTKKSAPSVDVQRTPLGLPVEIWLFIFELVLYPGPVMMANPEPCEIYTAFEYFNYPSKEAQRNVIHKRLVQRRKGRLRQVCKMWKEMVDGIETDYRSTLERKNTRTQSIYLDSRSLFGKLIKTITGEYENLEVEIHPTFEANWRIEIPYTNPVSSFTLNILKEEQTVHLETLYDIVSFPRQLVILELYMRACTAAMEVLRDIETMPIPLTTLSLFLEKPEVLNTCITVPSLVDLYLSVPTHDEKSWSWRDPWNFRWILPAVRNLSLLERQAEHQTTILSYTHPFFSELLNNHLLNIHSLLIYPITMQIIGQDSPLGWQRMPNLQVLATNFDFSNTYSRQTYDIPKNLRIPKSSSVRHLIQFQLWIVDLASMSNGLQKFVNACPKLESVTMSNFLGLGADGRDKFKEEIVELLKLCDERRVDVWLHDVIRHSRKPVTYSKPIRKRKSKMRISD